MEGDEQLFGVAPSAVTRCELVIKMPTKTEHGSASISLYTTEHRYPASVIVQHLSRAEMGTVTGYMIPITQKSSYVNYAMMKRHLWALFRQMGVAGKEVAINHAGKPQG